MNINLVQHGTVRVFFSLVPYYGTEPIEMHVSI